MNWYKVAQIWNIEKSSSLTEELKAIHELEYKYRVINKNKFKGLEQRRENIASNIEKELYARLNDIRNQFLIIFKEWVASHNLNSDSAWARSKADYFKNQIEFSGIDFEDAAINAISMYYQPSYNRHLGDKNATRQFMNKVVDELQGYIDESKSFKLIVKLRKNDLLMMNLADLNEYFNMSFNNINEAKKYVNGLGYYDLDIENETVLDLINTNKDVALAFSEDVYRFLVYPHWIAKWKYHENKHNNTMVDTLRLVNGMVRKLQAASDINELMIAVTMSLNTLHQNGNLLEDHLENSTNQNIALNYDLDLEKLNELSNNDDYLKWNEDLRAIGVEV